MMDHRPHFDYSTQPPLRVAILDNGTGSHQMTLLPTLRDNGFPAEKFASATELYHAVLTQPIVMVLLDTHLTGESGFVVARHLRAISDVRVVMLTGWRSQQESIKALHSGADVFVSKPVDLDVLVASLQSLARRMDYRTTMNAVADQPAIYHPTILDWQIQDDGWQLVSPKGRAVTLTLTEQCIVKTLAEKIGQLVSRDELIEAICRDTYAFDPHRLEMIIYRLRKKVLQRTSETLPLKTVRGKGYRLTRSPNK
jgi:two-component system, OmpR family, response regulator PhoP